MRGGLGGMIYTFYPLLTSDAIGRWDGRREPGYGRSTGFKISVDCTTFDVRVSSSLKLRP